MASLFCMHKEEHQKQAMIKLLPWQIPFWEFRIKILAFPSLNFLSYVKGPRNKICFFYTPAGRGGREHAPRIFLFLEARKCHFPLFFQGTVS